MIKLIFSLFFIWVAVSVVMFVFTMGTISPINESEKKTYWKWSLLLTFYIGVPVVGWIVGMIHMWLIFGKPKVVTQKDENKNEEQKNSEDKK